MPIKLRPLPPLSVLKELLDYAPETGVLIWRVQHGRAAPGQIAGMIMPTGYRRLKIQDGSYMAHRIAWKLMTGSDPAAEVDHIDGERSNNVWANLRAASKSQNMRNRVSCSKVGMPKGVRPVRGGRRFRAVICEHGKQKHLGNFSTVGEAAAAYASEESRIHGEFSFARCRA